MNKVSQTFSDTVNEVMSLHDRDPLPDEIISDLYDGFCGYLEYASYGSGHTPFDRPARDPKDDEIKKLNDKIDAIIELARGQGLNIGFEGNSQKPCYFKRMAVGPSHSTIVAFYD